MDPILIFLVIIGLLLSAVTILFYFSLKKKAYNEVKGESILDETRSAIEKQIYALNDRLILSEERWKDVNHLLLNKNQTVLEENLFGTVPYTRFIQSHGITENDLVVNKRQIFVLTPFNPIHYKTFFVIKETCMNAGFECKRGDESKIEGDLFPSMLKLIINSSVIVANITGRNPNVMYELGIAHALGKHVILISDAPEELPIDIKSKQFLIYRDLDELSVLLRAELFNIPKA